MIVGVPKEIKADEARVAMTPAGVAAFVGHGHTVLAEHGAGAGSGIGNEAFRSAGARIVGKAEAIWRRAQLIVKVKEPLGPELEWMRPGHIIYTFLHLASNEPLTKCLLERQVTGIGYETIQLDDDSLPLLFPMSEVAGRLSVQKAAQCLEAGMGGRGILISGASGVKPANVVILGGGVAGSNACHVAAGMGAHVTVLDIDPHRLRYIHDVMQGHVTTVMSNHANIAEELTNADVVIGAVLIPGARTPRLITRQVVKTMRPGSVILDIAIDQGGVCETSHPTNHHNPVFIKHGVVHYCVANMPGAVPHTSTYALTNATLGYGLMLADLGLDKALETNSAIQKGLNTHNGKITHPAVARALPHLPAGMTTYQ